MPDVGTDARDERPDLNARNAEGHVLWGPQRAVDPLRRYRADAVAPFAPVREKPPAAERRRRNRAAAKRGMAGLVAALRAA